MKRIDYKNPLLTPIYNYLAKRTAELNAASTQHYFSADFFSVSNPFEDAVFQNVITDFRAKTDAKVNLTILCDQSPAAYSCALILKNLFGLLKVRFDIKKKAKEEPQNNILTLKFEDGFNVIFSNSTDYTNSIEKIENGFILRAENILALKIFQFALGVLYSFDETFNSDFIAFDLEATGLSPLDELTEIGALKLKNGVILDSFQSLINPKRSIPYGIQQLTHITNEMVQDAPEIKTAILKFSDFVGNINNFVVHNGTFDISSMKKRFPKYAGRMFDVKKIYDTRALSQSVKPGSGLDLSSLANEFNILLLNAHRALADAEATAKVFIKLIFARNSGISCFFRENLQYFIIPLFIEMNSKTFSSNLDCRILFRAALNSFSKSKLSKNFRIQNNPLNVNDFIRLKLNIDSLSIHDIENIFINNSPLKKITIGADSVKPQDISSYIDIIKPIDLSCGEIDKLHAFTVSDMLPFDIIYNKIPVFRSGKLKFLKSSGAYNFYSENGKIVKILSEYCAYIKDNDKILYRIEIENFGFFKLFARTVIKPV